MQITNIRYLPLRYPLSKPVQFAWGLMTHRNFGLVLVETDVGLTGIGETSVNFPHWAVQERRITLEEGIKAMLVGEDPLRIEYLWQKMWDAFARLGILWGKGAIMSAIGGVDIALWDIAGKVHGLPIYALMGGLVCDRIPLYATGFDLQSPQSMVDRGYRALKMRVGFDAEQDIANVRRVRSAIGETVDLLVDVNMGWSRRQALELAPRYEEFGLYWLEEPLRADDLEGLKLLAAHIKMPLAAGENAFDRLDTQHLLNTHAVQYIMPDATRAGGLSELKRIWSLAWAYGVTVSPHHYGSDIGFAAALHAMAANPLGGYLLRDVTEAPLREIVLKRPLRIEDGFAYVPDGPGLGVELNQEAIEKFVV